MDRQVLEVLIGAGFDFQIEDNVILRTMASVGRAQIVDLILKSGVSNSASDTALNLAAKHGHLETTRIILNTFCLCRVWGNTDAIFWATFNQHTDVIELLVQNGARLGLLDSDTLKMVGKFEYENVLSKLNQI